MVEFFGLYDTSSFWWQVWAIERRGGQWVLRTSLSTANSHKRMTDSRYPSARAAWSLVALLTVAYIFSYIDRAILGLLIEPIKADLELSDAQLGLLLGPAFAIFYATLGLPFGWMADRYRRTWIVGAGALLWSLATFACGLGRNFAQLFVARMFVGVGEATLSPCAMSMIADSYPPERRAKPMAFYTTAIVFGTSIAYLVGATVLTWTKSAGPQSLPLLGDVQGWQLVFIGLGLAGILPALPFFFWREPPRNVDPEQHAGLEGSGMLDTLAYVWRHRRVYLSFVSLVCVMTIVGYGTSWNPAMFSRTFGWPAEQYALVTGLVTLPLQLSVHALTGWAVDRYSQRGHRDASLVCVIWGALLMVPGYALAPLMPNGTSAFVVMSLGGVGIGMITSVAPAALLNITPGAIRAQVVALYFMMISLTGLLLGPTTVGFLSANVFGEDRLNLAVASLPILFGLVPLAFSAQIRRSYRNHLEILTA
jgi:MFS family permease